jgi:hypothetical protein
MVFDAFLFQIHQHLIVPVALHAEVQNLGTSKTGLQIVGVGLIIRDFLSKRKGVSQDNDSLHPGGAFVLKLCFAAKPFRVRIQNLLAENR